MKIVATQKIRVKLYLFLILFSIIGTVSFGSIYISARKSVDVSVDKDVIRTVIIDAGHGGIDGGASADDGTLEKNLNLSIALKLRNFLNIMGIETVLTRDSDISLHDDDATTVRKKKISDLNNRLEIIRNNQDAIFVSIHQNHFGQSEYSGTQIFYSKNNPSSSELADKIRMTVISYLQKDNTRETKQSGSEIFLLNNSTIPSVMVECGFLSNKEEASKLKNENYQNELAFLISLGISDFFNTTEDL